jgi:hypothetical protein
MDKKTFEEVSAKKAKIIKENLKLMMESPESVFDYDPYSRWYLDNDDDNQSVEKKPDIIKRIDNVTKRSQKKSL